MLAILDILRSRGVKQNAFPEAKTHLDQVPGVDIQVRGQWAHPGYCKYNVITHNPHKKEEQQMFLPHMADKLRKLQ